MICIRRSLGRLDVPWRDGRVLSIWIWAAAMMAAALTAMAIAQTEVGTISDDAEYATSKLCGMCHKDEKTAWESTLHAKAKPGDDDTPWKHVTGWDAATGEGVEEGIACEMCHGRGSVHVKASADERKATIVNGASLPSPSQQVSICAQCHANYTPAEGEPPVAFTPGDDLLAKVTLLAPEPGAKMQQVNELVGSKHFTEGTVCLTCHTAHADDAAEHQLRKPVPDLCGECHADQLDLTHTKGQAKEGDTCVTCHMPDGSHAFSKPAAE